MSLNFNRVHLAGRLTDTPELKRTSSDLAVTTFTIAVDRRGKEKTTDFINCTAWRGTAEFISKWFQKGNPIMVEGSIQVRKWNDKDGNRRSSTEVVVDNAYFAETKVTEKEASSEQGTPFEEIQKVIELPF